MDSDPALVHAPSIYRRGGENVHFARIPGIPILDKDVLHSVIRCNCWTRHLSSPVCTDFVYGITHPPPG